MHPARVVAVALAPSRATTRDLPSLRMFYSDHTLIGSTMDIIAALGKRKHARRICFRTAAFVALEEECRIASSADGAMVAEPAACLRSARRS